MEDGPDDGEVFDHELTRVLREHDQMLEEQSLALLAAGATSISVPEVILHARLRAPRRWRPGLLALTSEDRPAARFWARLPARCAGPAATMDHCP